MLERNDTRRITPEEITLYVFCPADKEILGDYGMKTKIYSKLVHDRIPEVIESDGKTCITEILPDVQYLEMLDAKLSEELAEYQEDKSLEELADLLEVVRAVIKARGWTWEQLEQVRQENAAHRGSFDRKILLKEIIEN